MPEPWSEASAVDGTAAPAAPKTLLEQMQDLLASLTADLAGLQATGAATTSSTDEDGGPAAAR
ncbi:hypothetical protein ABT093_38745 [Kitasatospora sp. NPDC002551]|uniref:hypothetical protein n=1 Tax=unclassified Kitasatospora TaxID=2633591 RepID=UPI003324ECEB